MTFNCQDLLFKSYRKIFLTFLKLSSLDISVNVPKSNFMIAVNQKWLEDLQRAEFFAKGRAFCKEQDFTVL